MQHIGFSFGDMILFGNFASKLPFIMINQLNNDTLKAVGVRYAVNPELGHRGVVETEEMCQKTIAKLKWLDEKRPRVVLMADPQNKDTHAVMVRALGRKDCLY